MQSSERAKNATKRGRPFAKGNSGRPKGAVNKVTRNLREAIEESFEARGGAEYLAGLKDRDYCALLGRLLPLQIEGGDPDRPVVFSWEGE